MFNGSGIDLHEQSGSSLLSPDKRMAMNNITGGKVSKLGDLNSIQQVSLIMFESIMAEIICVVSSLVAPDPTHTDAVLDTIKQSSISGPENDQGVAKEGIDKRSQRFEKALEILKEIAHGPYRRLLAPYFCRVLIVQCGLRARILARGYLCDCPASVSSAADFSEACKVLQAIRNLETTYCQLLVRCLGDYLSMPLVRRVLLKLQATASQCGIAPLASNFCRQLSQSSSLGLRQIFIRDLLQNEQRFKDNQSTLRSILLNFLPVAGESDVKAISKLWAEVLTRWVVDTCCDHARKNASVVHVPLHLIAYNAEPLNQMAYPNSHQQSSATATEDVWTDLLVDLQDMLEKARSVSRLEFHEADTCHLAAEIAFNRAFDALPDDVLAGISKMIALRLARLLDESPHSTVTEGSGRDTYGDGGSRDILSPKSALSAEYCH